MTTKQIKIGSKFLTVSGKRIGVNYFAGPWVAGVDPSTIKIRPRRGSTFPAELRQHFAIENHSDMMTDYFEADCVRLVSSHPLYQQVRTAAEGR